MLKIGTILWIVLTIIVVAIPLGLLFFILTKRTLKVGNFFEQKFSDFKTLKKIKKEILEKNQEEQIEIETETIKDFGSEKTNIEPIDEIKELITKPKNEVVIELEEEQEPLSEQDKNIILKQKKLLERIVYEALTLKKEGKIDEYEKKLIEGLAIEPSNLEITKQLAELYFTIGDHKKALSLSKKIIEEDPEDHNAIRQIGEIYLLTGDLKTSEILVEKAINLKPTNPKYYISMVEILYNTERKKEAIDCMEKIVKLRPTNTNYMMTLADLYEEIDESDNAKKYFFKILELEPSNEKAKRKIKNYAK
ncbi:MAG: hypothetical protein WAZ12_04515 [Candidatus Absconditicoccaceae bacterium]